MKDEEPASAAMLERLEFTAGEWAGATAAYEAREEERARDLFGDGPRFAIPGTETEA